MQIVAIESGRAGFLVPIDEIRPYGGLVLPEVVRATVERYRFATLPNLATLGTPGGQNGVLFGHGGITIEGNEINIPQFSIYSDGIVADCFNTRNSEIIINDFFSWASGTFSLREPASRPVWIFNSKLTVNFDATIDDSLSIFDRVAGTISGIFTRVYGLELVFSTSRLTISADPLDPHIVPRTRQVEFVVEKKLGVPYSENRYFSAAPFHTDLHIELLREIENALLD